MCTGDITGTRKALTWRMTSRTLSRATIILATLPSCQVRGVPSSPKLPHVLPPALPSLPPEGCKVLRSIGIWPVSLHENQRCLCPHCTHPCPSGYLLVLRPREQGPQRASLDPESRRVQTLRGNRGCWARQGMDSNQDQRASCKTHSPLNSTAW